MKKAPVTAKTIENTSTLAAGMLIGRIVRINESGQIFVDFPGNKSGPVIARMTVLAQKELQSCDSNPAGREVLLVFVNSDPHHPVIVDAIYSVLDDIMKQAGTAVALDLKRPEEVIIDGKRVFLNADEEIVLQCGKASITLTKAGKVLIEGEHVSSISNGINKIEGGAIQLN